MTTRPDYELERIREARMQISAEFDHDAERLVKHYMELQEHHKDRLVRPPKAGVEELPKDAE
jgi:hypothetical protein